MAEGWLGEIEGIDLTLRFLSDKRNHVRRLKRITQHVDLMLRLCAAELISERCWRTPKTHEEEGEPHDR